MHSCGSPLAGRYKFGFGEEKLKNENATVGPSIRRVPEGDNRERLVCDDCGFVVYDNPKVVVGAVCEWDRRILLCRRAIEPRRGYWTIPAGYLELHESTEEGAMREALEEASAKIAIDALLAIYNIPRISQVQLIYAARLETPSIAPGEESLKTKLVDWRKIPWDDLAFPSVRWALHDYREFKRDGDPTPRVNPAGEYGNI